VIRAGNRCLQRVEVGRSDIVLSQESAKVKISSIRSGANRTLAICTIITMPLTSMFPLPIFHENCGYRTSAE
jgi:hypothetical protein